MIIHNCDQRSEMWYKLRTGKVTASNAHRLLTAEKMKTYALDLIAEQVTGELVEHYVSAEMQWGIDQEPFAMEWYQNHTGVEVETCGFIELEDIFAGCSPDLLVGSEGMVQIKCPKSSTHAKYFQNGPSSEIYAQMQFEMWIYGAKWNHFVSFDPRWPLKMQGKIHEVTRDDAFINKLRQKTIEILDNVNTFLFENDLQRKKISFTTANEISKARELDLEKFTENASRYIGV